MTRKRFVKLMMGRKGYSRNGASAIARLMSGANYSYSVVYERISDNIFRHSAIEELGIAVKDILFTDYVRKMGLDE